MFRFLKDESPEEEEDDGRGLSKEETRAAMEIVVQDLHYQLSEKVPVGEQQFKNNSSLKYILVAQLLRSEFLKGDERIRGILDSSSDLIPGVYEGGFKMWECTSDLVKYLESNSDVVINENTKVLDLGCGSGVLGLYALSRGGLVDFQDYNSEVIDYLTVPNVIVNFKDSGLLRCRFYSGDWEALRLLWTEGNPGEAKKYDVILSSETIYNLENLPKFVRLIKDCLKPDGCLLLGAKTCYFGVGGGTQSFLNTVGKEPSMISEVLQVIREGVQREIIKVTFRNC